jgi:hypothetical protein
MPAHAGIHLALSRPWKWIPAFAGMTSNQGVARRDPASMTVGVGVVSARIGIGATGARIGVGAAASEPVSARRLRESRHARAGWMRPSRLRPVP